MSRDSSPARTLPLGPGLASARDRGGSGTGAAVVVGLRRVGDNESQVLGAAVSHGEQSADGNPIAQLRGIAKVRPTRPLSTVRYELASRFDAALTRRAGDARYSNSAIAGRIGVDDRRLRAVRAGDRPLPQRWLARMHKTDPLIWAEVLEGLPESVRRELEAA